MNNHKLINFLTIFLITIQSNCLYFKIESNKERCFIDEFTKNNVVVIRYELHGISDQTGTYNFTFKSIELNTTASDSFQIKLLTNNASKLISKHIIRSTRGKFSLTIEETSDYKICIQNLRPTLFKDKEIQAILKIESDSQESLNLDSVLKNEDISSVTHKINQIVQDTKKIIQIQNNELESEDISYTLQHSYSKTFTLITILQIICVFSLGFYQIYQFRKFLELKNII